ncbi:hypothetical protein ABI59_04295 [Acidobacteria bacterium Mor1]|nr:hypothetical protein ABI59_04295 [Acidobacteria bacterium Mor1]
MDAVTGAAQPPGAGLKTHRRLKAFRAVDAFAIEAFRAARRLRGEDWRDLSREIRRTVARGGGALVAASAGDEGPGQERKRLDAARAYLAESRYYLYLARRLGVLDVRGYRTLCSRHDSAAREIELLLGQTAE